MPYGIVRKPGVVKGLREADLRAFVHLDVLAIARVHLGDHRLVTHGRGVGGGPAERFGPIRGKSLSVLRVIAVREGVAHDGVGEAARVPCVREPQKGGLAARGIEDRLRHSGQYRSICALRSASAGVVASSFFRLRSWGSRTGVITIWAM